MNIKPTNEEIKRLKELFLNDPNIKIWNNQIVSLLNISIPIGLIKKNGEIEMRYSSEVEARINWIRSEMAKYIESNYLKLFQEEK